MQPSHLPLVCLCLLGTLQVFTSHPISTGPGGSDVDLLKTLLRRLEESLPAALGTDQLLPIDRIDALDAETPAMVDGEEDELRARLDEAAIREFLSAKNLKSVRNNDSRKTSSCFGGRLDRIGAMTSLGCNTSSRLSPRRR